MKRGANRFPIGTIAIDLHFAQISNKESEMRKAIISMMTAALMAGAAISVAYAQAGGAGGAGAEAQVPELELEPAVQPVPVGRAARRE